MFNNISRTLASRAAIQPASQAAVLQLTARELAFTGRGKGGKHSSKRGNAAQLKRAAAKRNNIRKHG